MRTVTGIFWVVFALFILQACSGIKVSQDYEQGYDFSGLKTFAWKPNDDNEYGLLYPQNSIRRSIQASRISTLATI